MWSKEAEAFDKKVMAKFAKCWWYDTWTEGEGTNNYVTELLAGSKLAKGDDPLEGDLPDKLRVYISYPINNPTIFTIDNPKTVQGMAVEIAKLYRRIYDEEHAAVGDPGHVPGMLNRETSNGPYGIWGHDIGDLVLERLYQSEEEPDLFHPAMGS